jgi:adenosylcobinamide amidohydrolase
MVRLVPALYASRFPTLTIDGGVPIISVLAVHSVPSDFSEEDVQSEADRVNSDIFDSESIVILAAAGR